MTYILSKLWHQKWNEVLITDLACSFSKHFSIIQLCKFQYIFTTTLYWLIMTNCFQIFVQYPAVRHSSNSGQTPRQLQRLCVHLMNMSHLVIILCSPNFIKQLIACVFILNLNLISLKFSFSGKGYRKQAGFGTTK